MKITRPAGLTTAGATSLQPVPQPDPADGTQTACAAEKRHLAALQAVQTLSAQAAQIRSLLSASLTDELALCLAASLTAAWLQPPEPEDRDQRAQENPQSAIRNPQSPPSPGPDSAAWLQPPEPEDRDQRAQENPQSAIRNPQSPPSPGPDSAAWLQPPEPEDRDQRAQENPQSAIRNPQSKIPQSPRSAALLKRLKEFIPLLLPLRRGDQYSEWLQIQRQWQILAAQKHQDHLAAQKAKSDVPPRSLRDDGGFTKETLEKTARALNLF